VTGLVPPVRAHALWRTAKAAQAARLRRYCANVERSSTAYLSLGLARSELSDPETTSLSWERQDVLTAAPPCAFSP
jgi:hypothetical protein